MPEARFTEWDYGTGVAVSYKRLGECNMCGDCCKTLIRILESRDYDADEVYDGDQSEEYKYIWNELCVVGNNRPDCARSFIRFTATTERNRCCALAPSNVCVENGSKPWKCRVWPTCPSDIKLFPRCSYSFEEMERWEFDTT